MQHRLNWSHLNTKGESVIRVNGTQVVSVNEGSVTRSGSFLINYGDSVNVYGNSGRPCAGISMTIAGYCEDFDSGGVPAGYTAECESIITGNTTITVLTCM